MDQPGNFCPNCGAQIYNPRQDYCLNCGAQLGAKQGEVKEYNLLTAWLSFFKRYADFKGRSRRQEYWYVYLANVIIGAIVYIIQATSTAVLYNTPDNLVAAVISMIVSAAAMIYSFATIIPNFALQTRRLHDTGRSGKLLLLWFIPGIVAFVTVIASLVAMAASMSYGSYGMYYDSYGSMEYFFEQMLENSGMAFVVMLAGLLVSAILSLVFSIMFIVFFCQDGQRGENKYGKSPKYLS